MKVNLTNFQTSIRHPSLGEMGEFYTFRGNGNININIRLNDDSPSKYKFEELMT